MRFVMNYALCFLYRTLEQKMVGKIRKKYVVDVISLKMALRLIELHMVEKQAVALVMPSFYEIFPSFYRS